MKSFSDFKQQINEVLKASDPIEKWISDFVHSTNPKFAGKSKAERIDMAKGAYYGAQKNESVEESAAVNISSTPEQSMNEEHLVHVDDGSKYDEQPHEKDVEHVMAGLKKHGGEHAGASDKGAFFKFKSQSDADAFRSHVNKCPHRSCGAEHVSEAVEYKGIGTDVVDKKKKLNPQPNLLSTKKTVKDFKEAKVYDPITKKMVASKPIKVQAGGGATRNGVPVETGPSKYKERPSRPGDIYGKSFTEEVEQIDELSKTTLQSYRKKAAKDVGRAYAIHQDPYKKTDKDDMRKLSNRVKGDERAEISLKKEEVVDESAGLSHKLVQAGKEKWHVYDTKTGELHSTYNNKNVAMRKYGELNDKHAGYDSPGGLVKSKYGVRKEDVDLTEDIKKEYEGLKKHDIKTLRDMIKQQHRIIDTSEFRTKEHAISHILNNKHGNKRVMAALGESDESWAASQEKKKEERLTGKDQGTLGKIRDLMDKEKAKKEFDLKMKKAQNSQRVARALGEEVEPIDEISKATLVKYLDKAAHDAASGAYAGKDYISHSQQHTAAGEWEASKKKHDQATKEFNRANKRLLNIPKAAVKLANKKTYEQFVHGLDEATVATRKYDWGTMKTVNHGKSFSIPLHPEHHEPIAKLKHGESHSFKDETGRKWKATREGDTVHFHGGSYGTQKTSVPHSSLTESRGHKVLATFFKNREVAQRAFTGQNKQPEYSEKGIETPEKEADQKKKMMGEDQYTSEYKVKYYVDPITGESKTRKIRPHRVNFAASKMRGEPAQKDAAGDLGPWKEGFDNYDDIAKELIKRHGKDIDTGHINDLAGERDSHRGLDHAEVMAHVKKHLKEVDMPNDEKWVDFKPSKHSIADEKYKDFKPSKHSIVKALKKIKGEK